MFRERYITCTYLKIHDEELENRTSRQSSYHAKCSKFIFEIEVAALLWNESDTVDYTPIEVSQIKHIKYY